MGKNKKYKLRVFDQRDDFHSLSTTIQLMKAPAFTYFSCLLIFIYILDDPAMLRCGTVWLHRLGISVFQKTTVLILLSVTIFTSRPFPHPTFTGARGVHEQHQGYNYSYHRVQNSYQLFWKPWFDTNDGLLLFLHATSSNPCRYHC